MILGLAQIPVLPDAPEANIAEIRGACEELSSASPDWILFPECSDLGWCSSQSHRLSTPVPDGYFCTELAGLAREFGVFITCGLTEKRMGATLNSAVTLDASGSLIHVHSKIHELDIAHSCYANGGSLSTFSTPFGMAGVMICADGFAEHQSISRALCYMGADFILSPCAWAVPPDHDNSATPYGGLWKGVYSPVAEKFKIWIAAVSNVGTVPAGPWQNHPCIGNSMLVNPSGHIEFTAPFGQNARSITCHNISPQTRPNRGTQWDPPI